MRTLLRWLRLVLGLSAGLLLLVAAPVVTTEDQDMPLLRRVFVLLGLLGFALIAAGWGLLARWQSLGTVLRGVGLALFGLAAVAWVAHTLVTFLAWPNWVAWTAFGVFAAAAAAFLVWWLVGGSPSQCAAPVEPDAQGRLEVPVARGPTLILAVFGVFMAAAALLVLPIPVVGWVAGTVGVLFFGGGSVFLVLLVIRPGPAIRADAHGLEDRSSLAGVRRISWAESKRIRATSTFGQPMVAITPHDWATVVDRQPAWRRTMIAVNRRLIKSDDLLMTTTALPCSAKDLATALESMRRDHS